MTYEKLVMAGLVVASALMLVGCSSIPTSTIKTAKGSGSSFQVMPATDGMIKMGVKAFRKGDYQMANRLTEQATRSSLTRRKLAIAQSNLCAGYAELQMLDKAQTACSEALSLRPDYSPALANNDALNLLRAKDLTQP